MVRLVIVDDDADARLLLRVHLGRLDRYEIVGEAADLTRGTEVIAETVPDVIILDELLPGGPGHEAIPNFRRMVPQSRIIVWSSLPDFRDAAVAAGADRFLDKLDGAEHVITALEDLIPRDQP